MTGAQYLVEVLKRYNVTDAFGIPGGVILEMIYALNESGTITPHLCYHEQAAGFAAVGYAQSSGKLGVAYATRGPGFTNLVTSIADAYCDSVPVLFITSHVGKTLNPNIRLTNNQEIDTCTMVGGITKYAKRIESPDEFVFNIEEACVLAMEGRKGPVFIDVASSVWKADVGNENKKVSSFTNNIKSDSYVYDVAEAIRKAKRPIILIGDGINQTKSGYFFQQFAEKCQIPVLSSRYATNVLANSPLYFGYIGGFGVRYANFILSKTDLIISLGNRLNFPINSESYRNIPHQAKIVRFDIDKGELSRKIPQSTSYNIELTKALSALAGCDFEFGNHDDWISVCNIIKKDLWDEDVNEVVKGIDSILENIPDSFTVISDVGNHEFWVSRACAHSMRKGNLLYSKSFATLGSAMVKAIGAYYATKEPVVCFIGDQGFQMNCQELLYISQYNLPILVVIMNNFVSGMIRDKEITDYDARFLHSTKDSDYLIPDFARLVQTYNINYCELDARHIEKTPLSLQSLKMPCVLNMLIDENLSLEPSLPRGREPQAMLPDIDPIKYKKLCDL